MSQLCEYLGWPIRRRKKTEKNMRENVLDANREDFCFVHEEKQTSQTPKHTKNKQERATGKENLKKKTDYTFLESHNHNKKREKLL